MSTHLPEESLQPKARGHLEEVTSTLINPKTHAGVPAEVTSLDTHLSRLFFAGQQVFKVKKPVDLGFVDQRSLQQRLAFCKEEVRLNMRLAPNVYKGVRAIIRTPKGHLELAASDRPLDAADVVEYAVEMRRLSAHRMLDYLIDHGQVTEAMLDSLVQLLVEFHGHPDTHPNEHLQFGAIETIAANARDNFDQLEPFVSSDAETSVASKVTMAHLRMWTERNLDDLRDLFNRRVKEGRIRDAHGDLHCGNICFEGPTPAIYDCIEFGARYRVGDVASEIAFLAMDMDHRGAHALSTHLIAHYSKLSGDAEVKTLLPFYCTYRALVRAKVTAMRAKQLQGPEATLAVAEASNYVELAASYTLSPSLIVISGLPGVGKSFAARRIAKPLRAKVLRTDVIRKEHFGIPETARVPKEREAEVYGAAASQLIYEEVANQGKQLLNSGFHVVVDAVNASKANRDHFRSLAKDVGAICVVAHITCPERVVEERLSARAARGDDASDADLRVYLETKARFEEPTGADVVSIDGTKERPSPARAVVHSLCDQQSS